MIREGRGANRWRTTYAKTCGECVQARKCRCCGATYTAAKGGAHGYCPSCRPLATKLRSRMREYGLSAKELLALLDRRHCEICGADGTDVDHDHSTNKVRGLLCRKCNTNLGFLEYVDKLPDEWRRAALSYLNTRTPTLDP